ncbi:hypothetical protein ABBQ38_008976 [Trebouxia sp. C0009 RCD-2024]
MEWVDDVLLFMRKGASSPQAYQMAAPLLADIVTSLKAAASRPLESSFEAKLCFAHAETIVPLACLLGLFGGLPPAAESSMTGSVGQCGMAEAQWCVSPEPQQPAFQSKRELQQPNQCSSTDSSSSSDSESSSSTSSSSRQCDSSVESSPMPMECVQEGKDEGQAWIPPLPRPPLKRGWYGSMLAPYGANVQFVLHRRMDTQAITNRPTLFVEMMYNGFRVPVPGCQNEDSCCTLEAFLEAAQAAGASEAAFQAACCLENSEY